MTLANRIALEKRIVTAVVQDAIVAGYDLQVYGDGEDFTPRTTDAETIISTLTDLDDAFPKLRLPQTDDAHHVHWIRFVFGNDGWDVISDYTVSLDETTVLKRADAISDKAQDED